MPIKKTTDRAEEINELVDDMYNHIVKRVAEDTSSDLWFVISNLVWVRVSAVTNIDNV